MTRCAPLALVLLAACRWFTDGGETSRVPTGSCVLAWFQYQDRPNNLLIGPELNGAFTIRAASEGDSLASWSGESGGVQARRSRLDGTPLPPALQWTVIVFQGRYMGTWKVNGDSIRWSFDDDRSTVAWMSAYPWRLDARTLVARWGHLDSLGWTLDAEVTC